MTGPLRFTKPHVLRNRAEYDAAVREIDRLVDSGPPRGSEPYERLEFLSLLVEAYEDEHFPFDRETTPQDAVAFMMEQKGVTRGQVAQWLGGRSRLSEFWSGKRDLSLRQVRTLRVKLGIPADLLIP